MDLTGMPALDFAIGLSFVFLLLSVFASAIQEHVAGILKLRSKTLLRGLGNMLEETEKPAKPATKGAPLPEREPGKDLTAKIYEHPLIRSTYRKGRLIRKQKNRLPSYIAPRSFALALLDTLAVDAHAMDADGKPRETHDVITKARKAIKDAKLPGDAETALLRLLDDARGNIDQFRTNIEGWFDDTMARVSGWYKRQAQIVLITLAVIITFVLNVNTITIGERLWKDTAVRTAVVQQASKVTTTDDAQGTRQKTPGEAGEDVDGVVKLGVPMGWTSNKADQRYVATSGDDWLWKLFYYHVAGWLLTIAAISFGAPFWFDTLSRFSRLRTSGKPEQPLPASAFGKGNERVKTTTT